MRDTDPTTPENLDPATATWPDIIEAYKVLHQRALRMMSAGIALYRAVEDADPALMEDAVLTAADRFRAVVEENA